MTRHTPLVQLLATRGILTSPLLRRATAASTRLMSSMRFSDQFMSGHDLRSWQKTVRAYHRDTEYVTSDCDPHTRALIPPLHFSTTFERDTEGELSGGYMYSRLNNPTREHFEQAFTRLEKGGGESMAFSSGMQAASAVLQACPGAHVLLPDDLYHGVS